jgi:predicted DNA-binding transcriptional regulator AlpA
VPLDDELMTRPEVEAFFGGPDGPIHHTTLYRGIKAGRFPRPIYIGRQTVRWLRSECVTARQQFIDARDDMYDEVRRQLAEVRSRQRETLVSRRRKVVAEATP